MYSMRPSRSLAQMMLSVDDPIISSRPAVWRSCSSAMRLS
jgi:hypothetical protein